MFGKFTKKRITLSLLIGMITIALLTMTACSSDAGNGENDNADSYPEKDIDVYVGHGPGGGTDSFVRKITDIMSDDLGVNFNVINKEGGSGVIAMKEAMQKKDDGYTLIGDSAYAVTTAAETNEYGLDEVVPIARAQQDVYAIQVKKGTYESIDELVSEAKENPGEVTLGAVGTMGIDEITARRFMKEAGVEMDYIPEEDAGRMHSDVLGGHIDAMLEEIGPVASEVEDGDLEPLVVFSEDRLDDFPDVPSTVENDWDLTDGVERYLMVSADAPQEVIDTLEKSMKDAMETDEYKEYEKNVYLDLRKGWMGSEDFKDKLKKDIEKYKPIVEEIK